MEFVWNTISIVTEYSVLQAGVMQLVCLFFSVALAILPTGGKLRRTALHLKQLTGHDCIKHSKLVALVYAIHCHIHPIH